MRHDLLARWQRLAFAAALAMTLTVNLDRVRVLANQAKGQPPQAPPQEEKKDAEVPKAPKDDFMVQVYQALDAKKTEKLTHKEKYKQDKSEEDVEVVLSYFNWAVSDDDYWNRQISIDTKTTDGFVVEKIVKSGFGELGYVKQGDTKTQDVYRKEKITVTGGQATATMADAEIGAAEKDRFRKLLDRMVLKK
jgi:hypothetical protein